MLYIWPYIFFFSWCLIIPRVRALISPPHLLPQVFQQYRPRGAIQKAFPRPVVAAVLLALAIVAVRYNTIVHPFTLADNRHYVFYVFRILLRHPAVKYLATPAYIICAWAAIWTLGLPTPQLSVPPTPEASDKNMNTIPTNTTTEAAQQQQHDATTPLHPASTTLIYLLTTTLCLITAPLVEPRYLILPWILWRLHVAGPHPSSSSFTAHSRMRPFVGFLAHGDSRLWVETAWFLCVNVGTGYMFLRRGFEWPQEKGVVQRFMW